MNKEIIKNFQKVLNDTYKIKKFKELSRGKKTIFVSDQNAITLEKLLYRKDKTRKALLQNEIASISKVLEEGVLLFITATIDSELNNDFTKIKHENEIFTNIKNQHQEFTKFLRHITKYRVRDGKDHKALYPKSIRVFELTKDYNFHMHSIVLLNDLSDFTHYVKSMFHARDKYQIGRTEIAIDHSYYQPVKDIFKKGIKIIHNEEMKFLKIKKQFDLDIITNTRKSKGNMVYLKPIKDNDHKNKHITKYLFKYILKNSDNSIETKLCNYLKVRQIQFSKNFFGAFAPKDLLYKIAFTVYLKIKNNKDDFRGIFHQLDNEESMNTMIYQVANLIKSGKIEIHTYSKEIREKKRDGYIVFYTNNEKSYLILDTLNSVYDRFFGDEELIKYYEILALEHANKLHPKNFTPLWNDIVYEIFDDYENLMLNSKKIQKEKELEHDRKMAHWETLLDEGKVSNEIIKTF